MGLVSLLREESDTQILIKTELKWVARVWRIPHFVYVKENHLQVIMNQFVKYGLLQHKLSDSIHFVDQFTVTNLHSYQMFIWFGINYTITNWRVSLSKICHEWPNNAVTHECAQRMSELQRYLVMSDICLIMKLGN